MNIIVSAFVAVIVAFAAVFVMQPGDITVGGTPSPDVYQHAFFHNGLTYGENCLATSTSGTLTAATMDNNSCIYLNPTGAGMAVVSITLPASTTLGTLIPRAGNCQDWFIDASDLAAATTTTFVAGTGMDVVGLDATGAGTGADVLDGAEMGVLTLCRQRNTDVTAYITEWIHAD